MIYLDYGATSWPKPEPVVRAVAEALQGGSPGRGEHPVAASAGRTVAETREALAELLGVGEPDRLVFTGNATDGLNLSIKGVLSAGGGHAVITEVEHNAVIRPLRGLQDRGLVELDVLPVGPEGTVDAGDLRRVLRPEATRLVVVNQVSNVLGTIQPVEELIAATREMAPEALVLVDAAQSAGHLPLRLEELAADLVAFTGHKGLYGPQGIGALYIGERAEERLLPWREGGTGDGGERQPEDLPRRFEAGTANLPGIAGLGAGARWVLDRGGPAAMLEHEVRLARRLREGLEGSDALRFLGPEIPQMGIVTLVPGAIPPKEAAATLASEHGIACRGGVSCAPLIHKALGTWPLGALRFSVGASTREADVDRAAEAVRGLLRDS